MTESIMFEAKKNGLHQNQDGLWKLSLTVKDMPPEIMTAPMGQRLALVVVALTDDGEGKPGEVFPDGYVEGSKPEKSAAQKAVVRAGMLCNDDSFQAWAEANWPHPASPSSPTELAAQYIRGRCGIASRRELAVNPDALEKFLSMETDFKYRNTRR